MDVSIASSQRLFRGFGESGGRRILVIGFTMIHGGTRDMYIQIYLYIYGRLLTMSVTLLNAMIIQEVMVENTKAFWKIQRCILNGRAVDNFQALPELFTSTKGLNFTWL